MYEGMIAETVRMKGHVTRIDLRDMVVDRYPDPDWQ